MRKFFQVLIIALVFLGFGSAANALQHGAGSAAIDLYSFGYTANAEVYACAIGQYTAGYALAMGQDGVVSNDFPEMAMDSALTSWAEAVTTGAIATAGTTSEASFSSVEAMAGYDAGDYYGTFSGALAGTYVSAYGFYVPQATTITFSIDYYLNSATDGDEPGFALAGAGAMLAIYQEGSAEGQGHWLDYAYASISDSNEDSNTLTIVLEGLQANSYFSIFAGTAAWAMAYAPGDQGGDTAPVPEPATMLLLGTGLISVAGLSRKKFKKQ